VRLAAGAGLALAGYPLGRALVGSRSIRRPPDGLATELVVLGLLLPLVEERIWGALVEPAARPLATSLLFAAKHPLVDRRWDRVPGLALWWWGLAQVRQRSPLAALVLHGAVNAGGVLVGHATGRDQFS
jgi:hypothetical protein